MEQILQNGWSMDELGQTMETDGWKEMVFDHWHNQNAQNAVM